MSGIRLARATLHCVRITPKTCWTFVRLYTTQGMVADGEASLTGQEDGLLAVADRLLPSLLAQRTISDPSAFARRAVPADIHTSSIVSAIDQALWSLQALDGDRPLAATIGIRRDRVPVYANINRRTVSRTPEAFADSARDAMAAGHVAFKVAPFDEVNVDICARGNGVEAMQPGLARVAAVRNVVGGDARLMIDCHWRFDEQTAAALNEAAAELGVYWIETPLPEQERNIAALARLRQQCNALGMRQAGLETSVTWEGFRPFCEGGAYDVVMPDIKYVGGVHEMQRTAAGCAALGLAVSPHNPSGPICHAASLQLSATLDSFDRLELQFDESALFDRLVASPFAPVHNGETTLPAGPGLGISLIEEVVDENADRPVREWRA